MITAFHAKNFKALRDISLRLTPIHVLIGPNDSGKTSILHAIAALSRSVDMRIEESFTGTWDGRELVWHGSEAREVMLGVDVSGTTLGQLEYRLTCEFKPEGRHVSVAREWIDGRDAGRGRLPTTAIYSRSLTDETCCAIHDELSGVQYMRWDARKLALPVATHTSKSQLSSDGFGLALLLEDILCSDRSRFEQLEARLTAIYPHIRSIKLERKNAFYTPPDELNQLKQWGQGVGKALLFEHGDQGRLVPASQVSDGSLLVLAYLAILYSPDPPRLLLVEEPENGIHPKLLQEVITILKQISDAQSHTQIVLTTHSPYAVDLFAPEEVTLCIKSNDGSVALTRMSDSESVRKQISLFSLGEIWTAEGEENLAKQNSP